MKIEFNTNGQAFEDYGDYEVIRILEQIAEKVKNGCSKSYILDINGNKIGEWSL